MAARGGLERLAIGARARRDLGHRLVGGAADFAGKRLDYFVTGWGTGGTLTGAGQMLKAARPALKVVVCEPSEAQLLGGKEWKPHKIQGWTPDFVPAVLDRKVYDEKVPVSDDAAIATARALAHKEGLFVGISAGAINEGSDPEPQ